MGRAVLLVAAVTAGSFVPASAGAAEGEEGAAQEQPKGPNDQGAKLDQAVKQVEQLNYTEAQRLLLEIVQSGHATSEQLAKAYFSIGEVEAALGNAVEATDSFYLALMLEPALLYPSSGSPKIRERLNEARSRVTEVGVLEASAAVKSGVLEVQIANDPLQLVKAVGVVMTRAGGDVGRATLDRDTLRVQVDSDVQSIRVTLRDDAGNELKAFDVDPAAQAGPEAAPMEAAKPALWSHWGVWAGVAGALAIGGTYFLMEAGSLGDQVEKAKGAPEPDEYEISRLADRQDQVSLYGIVGFSLAGAAAITAGALVLLQDDQAAPKADSEPSSEARLVPVGGPRHIGAEFHMRF